MSRNSYYNLSIFRTALWLAKILPRIVARSLAAIIGNFAYYWMPKSRAIAERNLAIVTNREGAPLRSLARRNFANFLKMLADYFYCSLQSPRRIDALLHEWRGYENLTDVLARGKGAIVVTAHLGNWELGGMLLAIRGVPITVLSLPEPSSELTRWRETYRKRLGIRTITVGEDPFCFVGILNALRRNEIVAMLIDRPYEGSGERVEFFGHTTGFSTAPALLHNLTGAPVLPAFVLQKSNCRYLSFINPPIPLQSHENRNHELAANTQIIATVFEQIIRQHPDQWFHYVPIWRETEPSPTSSESPANRHPAAAHRADARH